LEGELYQPGDAVDLQLGASVQSVDGQPIANKKWIPFETGQHRRSNTDQAQQSYFGAASWSEDNISLRLSSVLVDSKKGIASQGHLSPDSEQVRFWRYPDWRLQQQNLSGQIEFPQETELSFTTWYQQFSQTIESYDSPSYERIEQWQYDDDQSNGGRLTFEHDFGMISGRIAGSYSQNRHCQTEIVDQAVSGEPQECFEQVLASIGGEIDWQFLHGQKLSVASAYDYSDTPLTGGRTAQPSITKWAGSLIYQYQLSDSTSFTASAGQRTRFPSMRELYGTSLGKFVINPDLKPETSTLYDVSIASNAQQSPISWSITPWYSQVANTLAMKNVIVNGKSLRQRYNLKGSTAYGIESSLTARLSTQLNLSTHLFWQHQRAETELNQRSNKLMQRPSSQVSVSADYLFANDWRLTAEIERTGTAFDEDIDATIVELPSAVKVNMKAFVPLPVSSNDGHWQFYVSFYNITNEVVLPQLGLPEPGRMFAVGLRFY
jgi:outer membrane receptor protein involved in Fe transport